ncbi:metallophosphoesterase [Candidatus Borrarchaeum sp.]|uniref:metallophosphoesterase family protein n=1 Tax=Candidatus Borrarchaeum sp. TaxID=2846742 RepID=UPI00257AE29A|nr:metallophosphoesterase [Candidatus Borrarchaeum sp.]
MARFVIMSDSHITEGQEFNKDIFKMGVDLICSIKADFYFHLGDIVESGTLADYKLAEELLLPIKNRLIFIPGNHDARNVGDRLYGEFYGDREFEMETKIDGTKFYITGLDSSIPDQNSGRVGRRSRHTLSKRLDQLDDDLIKVVVFHHHLLPIPNTGRERSTIDDAGDMLKVLLDYDVDIVINGHRHISNVYKITDGSHELIVINNGTFSANKTRYRELHSFSIINVIPEEVTTSRIQIYTNKEKKVTKKYRHHPALRFGGEKLCRIVHISDTHFTHGREFQEANYDKAVELINKSGADVIVHTGDVTNEAYRLSYKIAADKLSKLQLPKVIVPGHRDCYAIGWELFPEMIGPMDPVWESPNLKIIGINTSLLEEEVGSVGRFELQKVLDEIHATKEQKIVVVAMHHHLVPVPNTKHVASLTDAGEVLSALGKSGVDLVLTGHKHITWSVQVEDAIISNCGSLSSAKVLSLAGNVFNILDVYENGYVQIDEVSLDENMRRTTGRFMIPVLK